MFTEKKLSQELRSRIKRVARAMRSVQKNSCLLVSSAPEKSRSRDLHFRFSQDSDFYYLTGSLLKRSTLLIRATGESVLLSPEVSEKEKLWEGEQESAKKVARRIGAKLHSLSCPHPQMELKKLLKDCPHLFYPNQPGHGYEFARSALALPSHRRAGAPMTLVHTDAVLESLRLHKSPFEIKHHEKAVEISHQAFEATLPHIQPGATERSIADRLEFEMLARGGEVAFPSIVGAGESGATLHHSPSSRKIRNGEYVLFDFGASYRGYAADISRVVQVGDKVPTKQREVHQLVVEAQERIVSRIKPGKLWKGLYEECCEHLLKGLRDIGIVKGSLASLRKKQVIKKYFPHSLGHSLGLDVHDIGSLRGGGDVRLKPGMLVTVEPGLYFSTGSKRLPSFGIRIEDDILVTSKGFRNLTKKIPKNICS